MDSTQLSDRHLASLRDGSAISESAIAARGYRTVTDPGELERLGFAPSQRRVPGLVLPLWTVDGGNGLAVYRPDNPRVREDKTRRNPDGAYPNKVIKYELPKGSGTRLDCPPVCRPMLADPSIPLWITEGQKKADSLASRGLCAVALLGVWSWKGKNDAGGVTVLADFDYIALDGRDVRICFDSDVMCKPQVRQALDRLREHLQRKRSHVAAVYLPNGPDGAKMGVDDYLAAGHTLGELEALVDAPRPTPQAAVPVVELLDTAPATISRPLALLDGRAYAATWLHVKTTVTETINARGEIVKHDPPVVTTERRLMIVRDDGRVYADGGGDESLDALGLEVHLPEIPPTDRLWSASGVRPYHAGQRPEPGDVFNRVVDVVDRFIDFDRSLAGQRTMAEMIACYTLSTWFLDAFNVIGFLWPNGDRGSGKTQLLTAICELAYLGQVILSGGSFASLRDLADYGACLAFDDAEGLSDPKRTDPDKRALLLAGNRRGNTVPVKEPTADKGWRTRYVNTFCPRLFSATRLPDAILASRTVVVPLIRTPDRQRANADPLDYKLWPHDRRCLVDDLWALALARLPEMPVYEAIVNERARLAGRNLEPWRPLLTVAMWLDCNGVDGLWDRMEALSVDYQNERPELEYGDLSALVFRGLCECAISANPAMSAIHIETSKTWEFTTAQVTAACKTLADGDESDIEPDSLTARRIGRALGKMRFRQAPRAGGRGSRKWRVSLDDLKRWAVSYAVPLPDSLCANGTNGATGTNGTAER